MSRRAAKVLAGLRLRAVSCPGVHLSAKDDIYLSVFFMGQFQQSESLPAVFPLLFHEKMTFEKIFRQTVDPGELAVLLQNETVRIELVQLIPPAGDTLASFEEDARSFLFPEPKLVPPFSGVGREVLMMRDTHFPGIAPRLEFSTRTTITECPPDTEVTIYPNTPLRPGRRRNKRRSSSPRSSPSRTPERRIDGERPTTATRLSQTLRSQSLSPPRAGNTQNRPRLRIDSAPSQTADTDRTSKPMQSSWPGPGRSASAKHTVLFTSLSSSPLIRSSSLESHSSAARRQMLSSSLVRSLLSPFGVDVLRKKPLKYDCYEGVTQPYKHIMTYSHPLENQPGTAGFFRSYRQSHYRTLDDLHERVRGLLTTPKAVRRLVYEGRLLPQELFLQPLQMFHGFLTTHMKAALY